MKYGVWVSINDGWFSYFYCSECGHKEFYGKEKVCANCGALMFPEICENVVKELNAEVDK